MDPRECTSFVDAPSVSMATVNFLNKVCGKAQVEDQEDPANHATAADVDVDLREVYFLIMHFLSAGPCQNAFGKLWDELLEHELLPRRYHAWYSRSGVLNGDENDDGNSFHLNYDNLVGRYSHIEKDHLVKLLKQLMLTTSPPMRDRIGRTAPSAADVPTLLGTGSFSLLPCHDKVNRQLKYMPSYLRWPHMQADQVRGLSLREIGGGFSKHHRAPSIRNACYAIAKASTMVQKMQNVKKLRGHRDAVYCAIFDHCGRYVITGSDDRLVKIWSMETAFCLASCRGHEGDITDLSVSSNNAVVASASNDYSIRVWRLPDGYPISVLRGHTGAVTAIAFSPRPSSVYQLLSSSDDGTCRIWDARYSLCSLRVYLPKPTDSTAGRSSVLPSATASSSNGLLCHQILCCAYNANGSVFVTGSSDTYARVWSACKSNSDDPEQPNHEIDILAGHENDVNYVQFSGCAVASRSLPSDPLTEENIPKFKNSWFSHDNIVTCSRDGSAIIWIPRSRRSHGKVGRWIRAYHLKVPPPPMPPQPPRGGPRQRFLPTPRGVNMIVWSLDNRFVLAAIMDNRICVWNASDGSLVHSLTGHTASTYVLDVHPFNPRIAMSAGYDGKTILWDIWEGTPIRVYEISGRFKLVDGKFSQDGTSIVLSDDVGQIYLLNTGQGESQKDAKYDQFFLGDYRPLIQDTHGNVVDQETQLAPYRRNIQDPLCDSSMLPYPEPYQSMYQRRRLGGLGIEWRPSSIKFAVGTDIGIGQEFHILPLADLDAAIEPLPEFVDAMYWEPEIDVMNDDNDSEYNVTEGYSSEEQEDCRSDSLSSDPECSKDKVGWSQKNSRWRSKQKKPVIEVDSLTLSGRRVKKRTLDEQYVTSSRSRRYKKPKNGGRTTSRRKSPKSKSLRPQRVSARNAVNNFSQITETSTGGEDEDVSAGDSSDSESSFEGSAIQRQVSIDYLHKKQRKYSDSEKIFSERSEDVVKPLKQPDSRISVENKKKLVLKFSLRDPKSSVYPENIKKQLNGQEDLAPSTSRPHGENPERNKICLRLDDVGSSSTNMDNKELSEKCNISQLRETEELAKADENLQASTGCHNASVSWGKFKLRTSKGMQLGDLVSTDADGARVDGCLSTQEIVKSSLSNMLPVHDHQGTGSDHGGFNSQNQIKGGNDSSSHLCRSNNLIVNANHSSEPQKNPKQKSTIIKIKSKHILGDTKDSSQSRIITRGDSSPGAKVELTSEGPSLGMSTAGNRLKRLMQHSQFNGNTFCESSDVGLHNQELDTDLPDVATDAVRRSRSTNLVNYNFEMSEDHLQPGTSRGGEKPSMKDLDFFPSQEWGSMSKCTVRLRSSRNKREYYHDEDKSASAGRDSHTVSRKLNWLLLAEQEEGYRYIPQLGDEVVYLLQGHQEYLEKSQSAQSGPWLRLGNKIKAVEICLVEDLKYTTFGGSGDSSCQITLKFIDSCSSVVGKTFKLTLPELIDFPDFVVERNRYDSAMKRGWTVNDRCVVWWKNAIEEGGAWYEGTIVSIKDKSSDFPGSPWERCDFLYTETEDSHLHSPWELHDPENPCEPPHSNFESREEILYSFTGLLRAASRDKDRYGIIKLNEVAHKSDFVNRFPVPLSPNIIKLRLEHEYYRRLEALRHDIEVMLSNAESYFQRYAEFSRKMKRLKSWFDEKFSEL